MKPEVGQKYICRRDVDGKGAGGGYEPGRIFTCTSFTQEDHRYILWPDDQAYGVWDDSVVPYYEEKCERKKLRFNDIKI